MNTLISYKTVIISPPASTSVATGSTISATDTSQITDYDVARELDNFFTHLLGAIDLFAHVINLVYLRSLFDIDKVYFHRVWGAMARSFSSEKLTHYVAALRTQQWYKDLRGFRNVTTHWYEVECIIESSRGFMKTHTLATRIILPDNPCSYPPTHSQNREFGDFGVNLFKETSKAIDDMYFIVDARVKAANRIPI